MIKENSILSFRNSRSILKSTIRNSLYNCYAIADLDWKFHIDLESWRLDFYIIKIES